LRAFKRLSANNLEINHLISCTAELFIFRHLSRGSFWREWTTKGLSQVYYSSRCTSLARSIFTSCVQHVGRYEETNQYTPDGRNFPASTLFFRRLVQKRIQNLSALRNFSYGKAVYLVGIIRIFSGIIDKTP
jgi:hypothetical protein